jgi:hypothetical protein
VYEIVTRLDPWAGLSPVEACHEVALGKRMTIPESCPQQLRKIMEVCWKAEPKDRPEFTEILEMLKLPEEKVR